MLGEGGELLLEGGVRGIEEREGEEIGIEERERGEIE